MSNKVRRQPNKAHQRSVAAAAEQPWWHSPFVWVAALIGAALAVTLALSIAGDDPVAGTETAEVRVQGTALTPFDDGPDLSVGATVPALLGSTFTGDRLELIPDGQARIYGFFAHWCPHCQAELPRVSAWLNANELPGNVDVVAVSTSVEPTADNYPPSSWFDEVGWSSRVMVDDANGSASAAFGLRTFPYWVVTDSRGAVVTRLSGELTEEQFEALVDAAADAG